MTPEQQHIAIAEACGWKYNGLGPIGTLHHPTDCSCFDGEGCSIPDYLSDLNAMHEAEKVLVQLGDSKRQEYLDVLQLVLQNNPNSDSLTWFEVWDSTHATAAQRAEAFLRTIGKWKD